MIMNKGQSTRSVIRARFVSRVNRPTRSRRLSSILTCGLFVLGGLSFAFFVIPGTSTMAVAAAAPTIWEHQDGWLTPSNLSIYLTTDGNQFNLSGSSQVSYQSASQANSATNGNYDLANVVGINLSANAPVASFYKYIGTSDGLFQAQIYWAAPGDSQLQTNGPINGITYQHLQAELSVGNNPNWEINPLWSYDNGINMTNVSQPQGGGSTAGSNLYAELGLSGAAFAAAFLPPPFDFIIGGSTMMVSDYLAIDGMLQTATHPVLGGGSGNSAAGGWQEVANFTGTSVNGAPYYDYENMFMGTTGTQLQINGFNNPTTMSSVENVGVGELILNATNQFAGWNSEYGQYCMDGASVAYGIQIVPAVSIGGWIDYGTTPAANCNVTLQQDYQGYYTNFVVSTASNGYWHFFARPNATYKLIASYPTALGTSSSLTYTIPTLPSAGSNYTINSGNPLVLCGGNKVSGQVTNQNTGGAINGAGVTLSDSNGSVTTYTNGSGDYTIYFPVTAYYHIVASAGGYNSAGTYETMDTGSSYTVDLALTPQSSGGGGGGCVLYGTDIALANGSVIQVQYLRIGMKTLSYNVNTGEFENTTVSAIVVTNVTSVIEVDGFIGISGLTDQPIYVMLSNGTPEWTMLGQLNYSMKLFDPLNSSWIPVYNLTTLHGNFTVFDITTTPGFKSGGIMRFDYVANGILLDRKICGGCL